jgi:nitroreductase
MWDPIEDIRRIVDAAQTAPSVFNAQPWAFRVVAADRVEMRANFGVRDQVDRGNWASWTSGAADGARVDPLTREFTISCGAALFNLRLAIAVAGHDATTWLLPDLTRRPDLLASVEIVTTRTKRAKAEDVELYEAIWLRHTSRQPYRLLRVPTALIVEMERAAVAERAYLRLMHPREASHWLRASARADDLLARDPRDTESGDEREDETKPGGALSAYGARLWDFQKRRDYLLTRSGISDAQRGPRPSTSPGPIRSDFYLPGQAARYERRPQLMSLSTDDDRPLDWLRAGQGLQRALLTATRYSRSAPFGRSARYNGSPLFGLPVRHFATTRTDQLARWGVTASFLTEALELEDLKGEARRWPWRAHYYEVPQMVLRVGYAPKEPVSPPRLNPDVMDTRPVRHGP